MTPRVGVVKLRVMGEDDDVLRLVEWLALLPKLAQDRVQIQGVSDPYVNRRGGGVRRYVDVVVLDEAPTASATVDRPEIERPI